MRGLYTGSINFYIIRNLKRNKRWHDNYNIILKIIIRKMPIPYDYYKSCLRTLFSINFSTKKYISKYCLYEITLSKNILI